MKPFSLLFPFIAASSPTPPAPPAPPAPPVAVAPSNSASNGNWRFKSGASEIEMQTTGNVTFHPESDTLFDLHGKGTLRVSEKSNKDVRVLTAQGSQVTWQVNGTERPFNADGKDWLRKILKARPATPTPPAPPPK